MTKSKSTLLWLEGAKYEQVNQVQMKGEKIILFLGNGTIKLLQFEKYSLTAVGIQFWSQGRPGVLYKWDYSHLPEDDFTPPSPNMAA